MKIQLLTPEVVVLSRTVRGWSGMLNIMSSTECVTFGVVPELRKLYFRFGDGKENMSRPADTASWFKLKFVLLGNATSDRPEDEVGVATRSDIAMQQSVTGANFRAEGESEFAKCDLSYE